MPGDDSGCSKPGKSAASNDADSDDLAKGRTILRPESGRPGTRKRVEPELSALELSDQQVWQAKDLPPWKSGEEVLGLYRIEKVLAGGMGRVFIAEHMDWRRKLAIKQPNEMVLAERDFFARVLREAHAWIELGLHPNIAYCYYVRTIEEVPHIFVEYVDGGNLRQWIESGRCIDYRTSLDLAIQFCHGMEHAHSKGMIHRDIKPENVLMTREGLLKITDFGLVRSGGGGAAEVGVSDGGQEVAGGLTRFGSFLGTESYVSPEQARSAAEVDWRTDIFSFGVCLYEMLCGNRPFQTTYGPPQQAPEPSTLVQDPQFPADLAELLKRCVAWEPNDRYGSFQAIRQELVRIYERLFSGASAYAELELVDLAADGLNNRGVSQHELGNIEVAVGSWEEALRQSPQHLEATYNLALQQWRGGEIGDLDVSRRLEACGTNPTVDREALGRYCAYIHVERCDPEAAREALKDVSDRYEALFAGAQIGEVKCIRTLEGHASEVRAVAMLADGRRALSASFDEALKVPGKLDRTLKLWDVETGRCLRTLEGQTHPVMSVAGLANGRRALSGSWDKTLKLWEVETGHCIRTLEGHTGAVWSVAVLADGRRALSGSGDGTLKLWDLETGRCIRTLEGHTDAVSSVAVLVDGRRALSASRDKTLRLWELETGRCIRTLEGHTLTVWSVAVLADGRRALSASEDMTLKLWELETGRCIRTLEGHRLKVTSVAVFADGRWALSASGDKTLKLWELETGRCIRTLKDHTDRVESVAVLADGRCALSGSCDKTLKLWAVSGLSEYRASLQVAQPKPYQVRREEMKVLSEGLAQATRLLEGGDHAECYSVLHAAWEATGFGQDERVATMLSDLHKAGSKSAISFAAEVRTLEGHTDRVFSVAVFADGRRALSGSGDKTLKLWELETGRCLRTLEGHSDWVGSVAVLADGRTALSGGDDTLKLWELETGRCLRILEGHTNHVSSVAVLADGRRALSASWDKTLKLWELATGRCICTLEGHTDWIESVAVFADGRRALSGSGDKTLKLWDLETGRCLRTLEGHARGIRSVAVLADGRTALSGSEDTTLKLWELDTGHCIRTLEGHTKKWVSSVAVLAGGRWALSGSGDTLKLWDLETGRCIRTLEGHTDWIYSVAVLADGRWALSGSSDTLKLWQLVWELEFH